MFDIFDTVTAGSWADWLAATGTSLAFVIAAVSYRRSVNLHRRDQARLVYSKMIDVKYFDPGSRLEILPNGARMGVNGGGVVIQPPASP